MMKITNSYLSLTTQLTQLHDGHANGKFNVPRAKEEEKSDSFSAVPLSLSIQIVLAMLFRSFSCVHFDYNYFLTGNWVHSHWVQENLDVFRYNVINRKINDRNKGK